MTLPPISLPTKLIDPILVHLIRHLTLPLALGSSAPILAPLTTLPHAAVPNALRCALLKLWWLSLDHLPPPHIVGALVDLERTSGRPIMYSVGGLGKAALRGHFALMDAWVDAGLLNGLDDLDEGRELYRARHEGATGEYLVDLYEWWLVKHGLPYANGGEKVIELDLVLCSSSLVAGEDKCVQALELLRTRGGHFWSAPIKALVEASRRGYIKVLDWWWAHFDSGVSCSADAMVAAVDGGGHLNVLQWWTERFPLRAIFKKSLSTIAVSASKHGHVDILHWWFDTIAELPATFGKYTEAAMDEAAANGRVAVLDFWLACSKHTDPLRNLPLKYKHALDRACAAGQLGVLEWFAAHVDGFRDAIGIRGPCPLGSSLSKSARTITVECLDWRRQHEIPTEFSIDGMDSLRKHRRTDILDWIQSPAGVEDRPDPPIQTRRRRRRGPQSKRPIQEAIDSALARGDYALVDRHFRKYPEEVRVLLIPGRLRHRLVEMQFGIIEYLTHHGILNSETSRILAGATDQQDLSQLAAKPGNLPLVNWIRKHYHYEAVIGCTWDGCMDMGGACKYACEEEEGFEMTERDLRKAEQRGDLGFCRWVKLHEVVLRDCWEDDTEEEYEGSDYGY